MIAVISFITGIVCVCVCGLFANVRVSLLVKNDSTIFCKKADRRVAVSIVTEQPGFVSCSSEEFFFFFLTLG